jgi:hypothetical protein
MGTGAQIGTPFGTLFLTLNDAHQGSITTKKRYDEADERFEGVVEEVVVNRCRIEVTMHFNIEDEADRARIKAVRINPFYAFSARRREGNPSLTVSDKARRTIAATLQTVIEGFLTQRPELRDEAARAQLLSECGRHQREAERLLHLAERTKLLAEELESLAYMTHWQRKQHLDDIAAKAAAALKASVEGMTSRRVFECAEALHLAYREATKDGIRSPQAEAEYMARVSVLDQARREAWAREDAAIA